MALSHRSYGLFGWLSRLISIAFDHWKVVAVAAFFISPIGPHVRWTYEYTDYYRSHRHYSYCSYIGSRGEIHPDLEPECPLFALLDSRDWK